MKQDDCILAPTMDSFKLKKAGDVKIITLKIDGKAVVIDQEYPRSTTWESFHADQLGGAPGPAARSFADQLGGWLSASG